MKSMLLSSCMLSLFLIGCASTPAGRDPEADRLVQENRAAVMDDVTALAKRAQMFYRRAVNWGGGGESFATLVIGSITSKPANENGIYFVRIASASSAVIVGIGKAVGKDGTNPVRVSALVKEASIETTVEN